MEAILKTTGEKVQVTELTNESAYVLINKNEVQISLTEIKIIDVLAEINELNTKKTYTAPAEQNRVIALNNLMNYCRVNNIQF